MDPGGLIAPIRIIKDRIYYHLRLKGLKCAEIRPPCRILHTYASPAISAGEYSNRAARMLGHQSPVVTPGEV